MGSRQKPYEAAPRTGPVEPSHHPHREPPAPSAEGSTREWVSDYGGFDFQAQWDRRGRVTEVERAVIQQLVTPLRPERTLEVGVGFGRLTGALRTGGGAYVGLDYDPEGLARAASHRRPGSPPTDERWLLANAYHLPIADAGADLIALVRLYHHFPYPEDILAEAARALTDGGHLLVSYAPEATAGTVAAHARSFLRTGHPLRRTTVPGASHRFGVLGGEHPIFVGPRSDFAAAARTAGLSLVREIGTGFEEYVRFLPSDLFLGLGRAVPRWGAFPHRFALLQKPAVAGPQKPVAEWLACPACRGPLPLSAPIDVEIACAACGRRYSLTQGLRDLRWSAPGSVRYGSDGSQSVRQRGRAPSPSAPMPAGPGRAISLGPE